MKLSILMPVYNEETTIAEIIQAVRAAPLPSGMEREIVIVNDGSTDGSRTVLDLFSGRPGVKVFHQERNAGKTAALRRAIQEASGDLFLVQDADMEYSPDEYPKLLEPILQNKADVVYGSRFLGSIRDMHGINRFANVISNHTFNFFFGTQLTDINTCHKVFRAQDLRALDIVSAHFAFETEVTAKLVKKGLRVVEVPVEYTARSVEDGKKIDWPKALGMYWAIIRFRFFS